MKRKKYKLARPVVRYSRVMATMGRIDPKKPEPIIPVKKCKKKINSKGLY